MLGQLRRDAESISADGLNRRAVWCSSRKLLAVLVSLRSKNQRHFPIKDEVHKEALNLGVQSS
jgi:hypothetical protein